MATVESKTRRRRSRASRREARLNAPVVHHPTLVRNVPVFEVANVEGIELIHELAMRIVEQLGVDFRDSESLQIWRDAGAEVTGERVCCGREMLLGLVAKAPEKYTQHGRNSDRTVQVGGENMVVSPSYGPPFILDLEGERRHATLEDLNNLQKLNHMAASVHIAGGPIVEPVDVPVPHRHLHLNRILRTIMEREVDTMVKDVITMVVVVTSMETDMVVVMNMVAIVIILNKIILRNKQEVQT